MVLHVQPDDSHEPLFNRYRLMPKMHGWNYIIPIDMFDTCIPSARCCGSLLQFGMHKIKAPCLQHFTRMFMDRKMDEGVNICQSDPTQLSASFFREMHHYN